MKIMRNAQVGGRGARKAQFVAKFGVRFSTKFGARFSAKSVEKRRPLV
jgi:hypothetical protein